MKYCITCLQPDTRPNSFFDEDGMCPACKYFEDNSKIEVDWDIRLNIMKEILDDEKNKSKHSKFDCIIGVSGGKDSTRQALGVREKLKLNPLLVCLTYPPEQITKRGASNSSNLIDLGFDVVIHSLAPQVWKKVMRDGFYSKTNWARGTEQAIVSAVPRLAIRYKIPLIFWGENPGLQLGDMSTVGETGYDGNNLRYMNTVGGGSLNWLLDRNFSKRIIQPYEYPLVEEFEKIDVKIIYLGWFWEDWSLVRNGLFSTSYGLKPRIDTVKNTGDITKVSSLDEDWVTLNQMIKYYKYGFGRVSDHVNESIRNKKITREMGIDILEKFDGSCSEEYINEFCKYIEISKEEFWDQVHKDVNKEIFEIKNDGKIIPKFKVGIGL